MIDTRKLAENGFGEGLVLDASLFNLSNNSLSNCLNGTTITFNGNEFMLQNDMGNGRVETAYLPSGYVPIGMKEYGGIIYVASYNPNTNKGLIGSFPSPERNITSNELGNQDLIINPSTFGFTPEKGISKFYTKINLKDGSFLRPGDKFALGFSFENTLAVNNKTSLSEILTNFNNNNTNKLVKLGVSVLDSSGNLQDITDSLVKDPTNNYFLFEDKFKPDKGNVDDIRNKVENMNIYSGRLSGEFYLTAEINIPYKYELSITGEQKESNSEITFTIEYEDVLSSIELKNANCTFNEVNAIKQLHYDNKKATFTHEGKGIINYSITPIMSYGPLTAFTKTGSIDTSLLGTGTVDLTEWRYYSDVTNNVLYLNWGLMTYLRDTEKIEKVQFNLYSKSSDFKTNTTIEVEPKRSYSGNFMDYISLDKLTPNELYLVEIKIIKKYLDKDTSKAFYRFLYTGTYFNLFYVDSSIRDYKDLKLKLHILTNTTVKKSSTPVQLKGFKKSDINFAKLPEKEEYPFYYIQLDISTYQFDLATDYYLEECEMLPINLNKNQLSTSYVLETPNCTLKNIKNQSNSSTDMSSILDTFKDIVNNKVENDSNNTEYKLWYKCTQDGAKFNLQISTLSEYKADAITEKVVSNERNYLPVLSNGIDNTKVFGFNASGMPLRGFCAKFGQDGGHDKYCEYLYLTDYNSNNYSSSSIPIKISEDDLNANAESRNPPSLNSLLGNRLAKGLSKLYDGNLPTITFWIGGMCEGAASFGHHENDDFTQQGGLNKGTNYTFIVWKGVNDEYFILNSYYDKATKVVDFLKLIFKNVFIEQEYQYNYDFSKSNHYIYTQDYTLDFKSSVKVTNTVLSTDKAIDFEVIDKIKNQFNTVINSINLSNVTIDSIEFYNPTETILIDLEVHNSNIDNIAFKYINTQASNVGKSVITFTEAGAVDKIYTSDHMGKPLLDRIYFIALDTADENKLKVFSYLDTYNQILSSDFVNPLEALRNFTTKWDDKKQCNQLVMQPTVSVNPIYMDKPRVGEYGDGKHRGYVSFKLDNNRLAQVRFNNALTIYG